MMHEINYQAWALYENLGVFTAAALWCDRNPYYLNQWDDMEYIEVRNLVLHILKYQLDAEDYPLEKRNAVIMILAEKFDKGISEFLQECKPFNLSRNQLKAIAEKIGARPRFLFENDSCLNDFSIPKPALEVNTDNKPLNAKPSFEVEQVINTGIQVDKEPASDKVSPLFSGFKNLCTNKVSFVILKNKTAKVVIDGKEIEVHPRALGLKHNSQGWKLLEGAAANSGDLTNALSRLNNKSNRSSEKGKVTTAISRLNEKLVQSMGLQSPPIVLDGCYKFTFKLMAHEEIHGSNVTQDDDALNHADGKGLDESQQESRSYLDEFKNDNY